MTPERFQDILLELLDENPFAVRSVLKLLRTEFTDSVPTLAVTCEKHPRLLVNLAFVSNNCFSDEHVKAVICHEFLHLILRHTERRSPVSEAEHIAMDAVINSIIHRHCGAAYSDMMASYYKDAKGAMGLLRPPAGAEHKPLDTRAIPPGYDWNHHALHSARIALYEGKLVVDDISELVETLQKSDPELKDPSAAAGSLRIEKLLGGHGDQPVEVPDELAEALRKAMRSMNGHGIWRSPRGTGTACRILRHGGQCRGRRG